jgi:secreted trypsin-like serine protease
MVNSRRIPTRRRVEANLAVVASAALLVTGALAVTPSVPASAEQSADAPALSPFIVGGEDATRTEYSGFMASLQDVDANGSWEHFCGGSVISPREILTAAHCVEELPATGEDGAPIPDRRVVVGASVVPDGRPGDRVQTAGILEVDVHPDYAGHHDAAVLHLDRDLQGVTPVSLPAKGTDGLLAPGSLATVVGWGKTSEYGSPSATLKKVSVPILSADECEIAHPGAFVRDVEMCAGVTGKDSCQGDSGGPLFREIGTGSNRKVFQIGIVSWGVGCAATGAPGVYAYTGSRDIRDGLGLR